jgi:putative hydrolase of the HAD superfamily
MRPAAPRAVIFDVGGVLVHADPELIAQAVEDACGVRPDRERCRTGFAYCSWRGHELGVCGKSWQASAVLESWAAHLGLPAGLAERAWSAVRDVDATLWTRVEPEAVPVLAQLRAAGLPLGIISNANGTLEASLTRKGLRHFFDVVLDSTVVGISKPDPAIFALMERQLGRSAASCWYVGDDIDEVQAALDFGYAGAVIFDPYGFFTDVAIPTIESLRQLTELIDVAVPAY